MSGRKVFTAGEVLQAADVNDYLMDQSVMVFAGTAARGSAIPSPSEGMVTYLEDADELQVYTNAWGGVGVAPAILQVQSTTKSDAFSTNSTSYTDVTGLAVTITPSSTSSKIFVTLDSNEDIQTAVTEVYFQVTRNGTAIGIADAAGSRTRNGVYLVDRSADEPEIVAYSFLDSPSSTSALTYQLQVRGNTGNNVYINRRASDTDSATIGRSVSTITVMEVAG